MVGPIVLGDSITCQEAADEIERLQKLVKAKEGVCECPDSVVAGQLHVHGCPSYDPLRHIDIAVERADQARGTKRSREVLHVLIKDLRKILTQNHIS